MDSYFQVRDAERTAWFTSQEVRNIADVAAMVTKALDAAGGEGETSVQALADHGGVSLRPISADRFSAQVRDLFCEPPGKLLAELDLKDDTFYCASWVPREEHCVAVSGMISRLLGVYELAMVERLEKHLDLDRFCNEIWDHLHVSFVAPRMERQSERWGPRDRPETGRGALYKRAADLVATYEELLLVPDEACVTHYLGDLGIHIFKYDAAQEQIQNAYDALSRHLKDETVEDKLGDYLDQLINELVPEQEYSRISQELWQEDRQARQELEAARKFAIFRIRESGQDRCLQVERPLEFLDAARLLRSYLRGERGASSFEQMLHQAEEITPEAFEDMVLVRMENTGKVTGTFELDFDKREFSAVNVMDGWQTFAMGDVSKAVYQADRKAHLDSDQRWVRFLDALDGRQITSAGHLSAREVRMAEEISEVDGLLNFYLETSFDVDAVFGTQVCTAENGDWLNVYANYDMNSGQVCDELEIALHRGDGSETALSYHLNAAEKEVLLRKMEDYCQEQTGMGLAEYSAQIMAEAPEPPTGPAM